MKSLTDELVLRRKGHSVCPGDLASSHPCHLPCRCVSVHTPEPSAGWWGVGFRGSWFPGGWRCPFLKSQGWAGGGGNDGGLTGDWGEEGSPGEEGRCQGDDITELPPHTSGRLGGEGTGRAHFVPSWLDGWVPQCP